MASSDKDVPPSMPASPSAASISASAVAAVSAHRTCPHCTKRMSSLKYDLYSLCVACRDVQCSVDVRCSECQDWLTDFMFGYIKHKKSLVSKGKKKTSSPSVPIPVTTTAPVVPPSLPVSTDDQLRIYVHSFLADFLSQSGQLGTNRSFSAPPAVPNSTPLIREAAGGLGADAPTGVPPTESPGEVLSTYQEDVPPPKLHERVAETVARSGVDSLGGSLFPGLGHDSRVSDGTDHLRVSGISHGSHVNVASALSPTSLLFPFSDSGFASLPSSLSTSSTPIPFFSASSTFSSSFSSSSFLSSSTRGLPSVAPSVPPSPLPPPSLPSVIPSVLSLASALPRPGAPLPLPPPGFPSLLLLFLLPPLPLLRS